MGGGGQADELRALGMQLPLGGLSVHDVAVGVGRSAPVRTIDVASQGDGPRMSMGEWEAYWAVRTAPKKGADAAPAAGGGGAQVPGAPGTPDLEPADGGRVGCSTSSPSPWRGPPWSLASCLPAPCGTWTSRPTCGAPARPAGTRGPGRTTRPRPRCSSTP